MARKSSEKRGIQEPQSWLPAKSFRCDYVADWISVKYRWRLSVDAAEKRALTDLVGDCGTPNLRIPDRAVPKPAPEPAPIPEPVARGPETCAAARAEGQGPFVRGTHDEYAKHRDDDGDGIACEDSEALSLTPSFDWRTQRFSSGDEPMVFVMVTEPDEGPGSAYANASPAGRSSTPPGVGPALAG